MPNYSSYGSDLTTQGLIQGGTEGFIRGLESAEDRKLKSLEYQAKVKSTQTEADRHAVQERIELMKSGLYKDKQGQIQRDLDYQKRQDLEKGLGSHQRPVYSPDGKLERYELDPEYAKHEIEKAERMAGIQANARPPNENQFNAAGYVKRMEGAEGKLKILMEEGFDPTSRGTQLQRMTPGWLESKKDPGVKRYEQIVRDFASAILRKQSGAAISPTEYKDTDLNYFPQPGDDPATIANKEQSRAQAIAALKAEGGRAYNMVPTVPVPKGKGLVNQGLTGGKKGLVTAPKAEALPAGKVKVNKGKETLIIDEADLNEAIKDGYKKVN